MDLKKFQIGIKENVFWITSGGEKIPPEKLTTTHINNILNGFVRRTIPSFTNGGLVKWGPILESELKRRRKNGKIR